MLGAIKDGLLLIIDFISSLVEFLVTTVAHTFEFVTSLTKIVAELPTYLEYLPPFISLAFIPIVTLLIVLRLLGRTT